MSTRLLFEAGLRNLTWSRAANPNLTIAVVLRTMQAGVVAGLVAAGSLPELQRQYCKLIGCVHSSGEADGSRERWGGSGQGQGGLGAGWLVLVAPRGPLLSIHVAI
jgi:hypothetical protein